MQVDLGRLERIFEKMLADGFNISDPLKWGFFFFDNDSNKLRRVFEELKDKNYIQEDLNEMDDGKWRLYVSKVDILTPEKLHKRNIAFNELAEYCDVELYDGWDVEKIPSCEI